MEQEPSSDVTTEDTEISGVLDKATKRIANLANASSLTLSVCPVARLTTVGD
jgi:hypothetical protein